MKDDNLGALGEVYFQVLWRSDRLWTYYISVNLAVFGIMFYSAGEITLKYAIMIMFSYTAFLVFNFAGLLFTCELAERVENGIIDSEELRVLFSTGSKRSFFQPGFMKRAIVLTHLTPAIFIAIFLLDRVNLAQPI